jgi:tripartite-type tricarboxylate transporter receptor subunit TctC
MAAPKGTPDTIVRLLRAAAVEALDDPAVAERFATLGLLVPHETREQFVASLKSEADLWLQTIQRGNITIQ